MSSTERRVVTVVFADLVEFTALSELLDAEDVARIQETYFGLASGAVAAHGGNVEKFIGDAVMATFGASRADDADPVRAVRAAQQLVADLASLERALVLPAGTVQVRVGVNTGEVVVTRDSQGWRVTGDTVNTAARLQTAAAPGEVLLGPETAFGVAHTFVIEDHSELQLKGKAAPVRAWRVARERAEPRRGLLLHGLHAPLLGREEQLGRLDELLGQPHAAGLLLVSPPGVGKSRLVEEFLAATRPADDPWTVRLGDEPDHGYGVVAQLVRKSRGAGISPGDITEPGLAAELSAVGYDDAQAAVFARHTSRLLSGTALDAEPGDLYPAWTAVLDAAPVGTPIWVVEDFHLATPDLVAFARHALAHARPGRLLIVTARPTSRLAQSMDALGALPVMHLEPLTPEATTTLVTTLVGAGVLPDPYVAGIVSSSGGNPLFVEELLRSWIQSGLLSRTGAGWALSGEVLDQRLPSTVQAIYQGQLDALPAGSRTLVERGSVPGTTFPVDALPVLGVAEPRKPLTELAAGGLLTGPHEGPMSLEAYTYRHPLLRDTAYGSLSRHDRAELHARFARWLQANDGGPLPPSAELVGRHLAVAVDMLPATASGLDDGTPTSKLAVEAADLLERAADGHLVSSPQRSAELLQRALELPGGGGGNRLRRELMLAEAERRSGRLEAAMTSFAAAADAARARDDGSALVTAAVGYENALFASRLPRDTWGRHSVQLLRAADSAVTDDDRARSFVLAALGRALFYSGDTTAGTEACEQAVRLAEASGDPAALAQALLALRVAQEGPAMLAQRLAGADRVAAAADLADDLELRFEAARLRLLDLLETGDMAAADEAQAEASTLVERLGRPLYFWYPPMWRSMRALFAGSYAAADELIERFRYEGRRAHYNNVDLVWAIQQLRLHLDTTGVQDLVETLEGLAKGDPGRWSFAIALTRARLGDSAGAQAALDYCTADDFAVVPRDLSWSNALAHLADAAAELADSRSAALLAPHLAPWAGHNIVLGAGALCLGSGSHYLGICLRTMGDLENARLHLADAVASHDAAGAAGLAARSRLELARVLIAGGEAAGGRRLAEDARAAAAALGMTDPAQARETP